MIIAVLTFSSPFFFQGGGKKERKAITGVAFHSSSFDERKGKIRGEREKKGIASSLSLLSGVYYQKGKEKRRRRLLEISNAGCGERKKDTNFTAAL